VRQTLWRHTGCQTGWKCDTHITRYTTHTNTRPAAAQPSPWQHHHGYSAGCARTVNWRRPSPPPRCINSNLTHVTRTAATRCIAAALLRLKARTTIYCSLQLQYELFAQATGCKFSHLVPMKRFVLGDSRCVCCWGVAFALDRVMQSSKSCPLPSVHHRRLFTRCQRPMTTRLLLLDYHLYHAIAAAAAGIRVQLPCRELTIGAGAARAA